MSSLKSGALARKRTEPKNLPNTTSNISGNTTARNKKTLEIRAT